MSTLSLGSYEQSRFQYDQYYDLISENDDISRLISQMQSNNQVDFERPELQSVMIKYITIRDCLMGEAHIKAKAEIYLPRPSDEKGEEEDIRFAKYIRRATFLNATGLTQRTIVGKLFSKPPTVDLPPRLEALRDNVNGEGLSFNQLIEQVLAETFAFGRCGLYADFKQLDSNSVSISDAEELSPTITFVRPENIINWRIDKSRKRLTLVVIREFYESYDKFNVKKYPQYRVFALSSDNKLQVRIYRPKQPEESLYAVTDGLEERFSVVEQYYPLLPDGQNWDVIPFALVGSTDNDWTIDEPPLYQIANYDLALYRNSADIEEAAFYVGQPTPYISGVDQEWVDEMGLREMRWGSGTFLPLEHPDSKVGLVQASPETLLDTLIDYKMSILRHLGATVFSTEKLAEDQTATGAIYQALQIHAPLVTTSRNVVEAFQKVVGFAAMFVGVDPDSEELEIRLNSDILDNPLGVTGLQMALQLWQSGGITWDEFREQLRVQGLAQHNPEEAKAIITADPPPMVNAPAPNPPANANRETSDESN